MDRVKLPLSFFFLFFLTQAFLFNEAWESLVTLWLKFDYAYSMGFLACALAAYSIYNSRQRITEDIKPLPFSALFLLLFSSALLVIADFLSIQIGTQLMLIPILYLGACTLLGYRSAKQFLIPLLYVLFTIPVWDYINTPLQTLTTLASTWMVEMMKLPAYIDGNTVHLPYGALEIAGGCSGLRYFLVTLILSLYFSQQRPNATYVVALIFIIAAMFSLLANWIRVTALIVIAEKSNMQSELVADHEMFGWFVYAAVMVPCVLLLLRIERSHLSRKNNDASSIGPAPRLNDNKKTPQLTYRFIATIAALCLPIITLYLAAETQTNRALAASAMQIKPPPSPWIIGKSNSAEPFYEHGFTGIDRSSTFTLLNSIGKAKAQIQIHSYFSENQGKELVNDNNTIVSNTWRETETGADSLKGVKASIISDKQNNKIAVFWYYRVGNVRTTSTLKAKLAGLLNLFAENPEKALVSTALECRTDCQKERLLLSNLLESYRPY